MASVLAAALALSGCTPAPASAPPVAAATPTAQRDSDLPSSSRTQLAERLASPRPVTVPHDLEPTQGAATNGATEVALTAMGRFCRPTLRQAAWIAGLDPLLTLEAASAYATVDPRRVACTRVLPPARRVEGDGFTQIVSVRTDGPRYQVTVTRGSLSGPWLVSLIEPASRQ